MLRILIHHLVKIAGPLCNPPKKLCEIQLFEQLSGGLADRGGFGWVMPLENRRPEPIPNNSAQAEKQKKPPIPKVILNSSEQIVEANNAQLTSLFLPMEAKSVSTDHPFYDSTTEIIQNMQLRQGGPFQQFSEEYCIFCNTVLYPDGVYHSCLDGCINFDSSIHHSIASQTLNESAAWKPLDHVASADLGEILHPALLANVEKAKEYMYEGFPSS